MPRQKSKPEGTVIAPETPDQTQPDNPETQEQDLDDRFTLDQIADFLKKKAPFADQGSLGEALGQLGSQVSYNFYLGGMVGTAVVVNADVTFEVPGDTAILPGIGAAVVGTSYQEAVVRAQGNAVRNALAANLSIPVKYLPDPELPKAEAVVVQAPSVQVQPQQMAQLGQTNLTTQPARPPVTDIPAEVHGPVCTDCGGEITGVTTSTGKYLSEKVVLDMAMKQEQVPLCWKCKNRRWGKKQGPR